MIISIEVFTPVKCSGVKCPQSDLYQVFGLFQKEWYGYMFAYIMHMTCKCFENAFPQFKLIFYLNFSVVIDVCELMFVHYNLIHMA